MVINVEETQPVDWITENDQKGIHEFQYLGEVEYVCPEKKGPSGRCMWWETNDRMEVRVVSDDCEGDTNGHDEGDEKEGEVVEGWDGFEEVGLNKGMKWEMREEEGEGKVEENCES